MTRFHSRLALALTVLAACGGDDDVDGNAGDGSGTLLVNAEISSDGEDAEISVDVSRDGQDIADADVLVGVDEGDDLVLVHVGDGEYRADHAGWSGSYSIEVTAGDDWLDGSLDAPSLPVITDPSPIEAFDPHEAEDGVVVVVWDGDGAAMSARVRTRDFEWEGEDTGTIEVPATVFEEEDQEVEVRRQNEIALEGGAPGSSLSVSSQSKTDLIVVNPY